MAIRPRVPMDAWLAHQLAAFRAASIPERRSRVSIADNVTKIIVTKIIVEQLGVDAEEVTPDASFVDGLGADSLDRIELMMACEEAFGIVISDEDAEQITTVSELFAYVEAHATVRT